MLCIGIDSVLSGSHQEVINKCLSHNGFVILAHPNWKSNDYWKRETMYNLKGYIGIEIYNGVIFLLTGSGLATYAWDHLLSRGKLVWGFDNDDFHRWQHMARGWKMIYSSEKSYKAVKDSIRRGCFYSSTGLVLKDIRYTGNSLEIYIKSDNTYVKNL